MSSDFSTSSAIQCLFVGFSAQNHFATKQNKKRNEIFQYALGAFGGPMIGRPQHEITSIINNTVRGPYVT